MILPLINISRYAFFCSEQVELLPNNHYHSKGLELRGRILDRNNRVLASSEGCERVYPFGECFEPVLGYANLQYDEDGLEKVLSDRLQGYPVPRNPWQAYLILNKRNRNGDDIVTSLDVDIQREAYNALRGYRGAAVVLDVNTGELLALASRPAYDPNYSSLKANWESLSKDDESPLFNRPLQVLYPPGSTFKVLVMAGALEDRLISVNEIFDCNGSMTIGDYELNCHGSVHGRINLLESLAYSCNVTFANLGQRLHMSGLRRWISCFRLDENFKYVPLASEMHVPEDSNLAAEAVTAIGQADTMVSPLHMARLAATIARGGEDIEPTLILRQLRGNKVVWRGDKDRKRHKVVSSVTAAAVARAMRLTVTGGTASACNGGTYSMAGKTGSAENPQGDTHAWFIGYAPVDNPRLAVAVILENAGGGGKHAAPVAKEIIENTLPIY